MVKSIESEIESSKNRGRGLRVTMLTLISLFTFSSLFVNQFGNCGNSCDGVTKDECEKVKKTDSSTAEADICKEKDSKCVCGANVPAGESKTKVDTKKICSSSGGMCPTLGFYQADEEEVKRENAEGRGEDKKLLANRAQQMVDHTYTNTTVKKTRASIPIDPSVGEAPYTVDYKIGMVGQYSMQEREDFSKSFANAVMRLAKSTSYAILAGRVEITQNIESDSDYDIVIEKKSVDLSKEKIQVAHVAMKEGKRKMYLPLDVKSLNIDDPRTFLESVIVHELGHLLFKVSLDTKLGTLDYLVDEYALKDSKYDSKYLKSERCIMNKKFLPDLFCYDRNLPKLSVQYKAESYEDAGRHIHKTDDLGIGQHTCWDLIIDSYKSMADYKGALEVGYKPEIIFINR